MLNAMTIDVEDYFQVTAFEKVVQRADWPAYESRVASNTHRLLRLLARHEVRATFFVLGWVARRIPQLVRDIQSEGHEIGSHSYWHRLVYEQSPAEFRDDLRLSCEVIEDILGAKVTCYRAPSFSITARSEWALDILVQQSIHIDSSVFPIHHDRYGIPDGNPNIHAIRTRDNPLWEFPPTTVRYFGQNFPAGGGGYLRLFPLRATSHFLARRNRQGSPAMVYVHPWELDPDQPRIPGISRTRRFRHFVNLGSTETRLAALLKKFRFATITEAIAEHEQCFSGSSESPLLNSPDRFLEESQPTLAN